VLLVIPTTPLMMIMSNLSSSYVMMIAIFTLIGWCGTARMVRAQVLSITNMNYIRAAELAGGSKTYIMFKHILPSVAHLLIMNCALSCAGFMIAEAGLSFIGLGDPSVMSWGKILVAAEASAFTSGLWAWVIAPGVAIFITVYGFMQIGYALEEILSPKMKRKKDTKKNGLSPEAAANAVFAEIADMSEEEAEIMKKEFCAEVKNG
jgi:peptide/nickel transport system permease protein